VSHLGSLERRCVLLLFSFQRPYGLMRTALINTRWERCQPCRAYASLRWDRNGRHSLGGVVLYTSP